jgi:hypothetical protein
LVEHHSAIARLDAFNLTPPGQLSAAIAEVLGRADA